MFLLAETHEQRAPASCSCWWFKDRKGVVGGGEMQLKLRWRSGVGVGDATEAARRKIMPGMGAQETGSPQEGDSEQTGRSRCRLPPPAWLPPSSAPCDRD